MKKSIRHQACDILNQVSLSQAFAGKLLHEYLEHNNLSGTPNGRLLTHVVYGVLRQQGHLDFILTKLYQGNFSKLEEGIKNVLRTGLFQLKFSDRLPVFAVVNETVKIAKIINPSTSGLVNAILRNYLRRSEKISFPSFEKSPAEHIAAVHSHPLWLIKNWIKLWGTEQTLALCKANNEMPPLTLRVNTLKISREELAQKLTAEGYTFKLTKFSPDGIILTDAVFPIQKTTFFKDGLLRIQDEAAQLVSYMINPKSNEKILDVCAGTGGKTTHLAAILKNKGHIIAADRDGDKIAELKKDAVRLGISIIETSQIDLSVALPDDLIEKFDHVLVDVPCSGTGTLRRNPEIKWRTSTADLNNLITTQKTILQNASKAVKNSGRLIYCTCSLLTEENESIVDNFLKTNRRFSLCQFHESINSRLFDSRGFYHTYPHLHNMDGFFGVILKRQ